MAFSGALVGPNRCGSSAETDLQTITDLDDFLTPSQACIIPVRGAKTEDIGPVCRLTLWQAR